MDFLETHFYIVCLILAALGLMVGRFLNIIIMRYPLFLENQWRRECQQYLNVAEEPKVAFDLFWPRSYCPHCGTPLKWHHTIPVLSYFLLEGRCAYCHEKISKLYPMVELLTGLLFVIVIIAFQLTLVAVGALILTSIFICLFFIDLRKMILPDTLTLSGLWLGLLFNVWDTFVSPAEAILGALVGYGFLWIVATLFKKVRNKPGMGHGDFKMLGMVGAWLGLASMADTLILSVIFGLLVTLFLLLLRKTSVKRPIPFGSYIAVAGWFNLITGPTIIRWLASLS